MNTKIIECPACGENMQDTGKREQSKLTKQPMRIMICTSCGNESGVSISAEETQERS